MSYWKIGFQNHHWSSQWPHMRVVMSQITGHSFILQLLRLTTKKHQHSKSLALCGGNPTSQEDSPHKRPAMPKAVPHHDIIITTLKNTYSQTEFFHHDQISYKNPLQNPSSSLCLHVFYHFLFSPYYLLFWQAAFIYLNNHKSIMQWIPLLVN